MVQIAAERHKQIFEMRSSGKSLREIGKLLGISGSEYNRFYDEVHQHRLIEKAKLRSRTTLYFNIGRRQNT